jgi:hypothetical protein
MYFFTFIWYIFVSCTVRKYVGKYVRISRVDNIQAGGMVERMSKAEMGSEELGLGWWEMGMVEEE